MPLGMVAAFVIPLLLGLGISTAAGWAVAVGATMDGLRLTVGLLDPVDGQPRGWWRTPLAGFLFGATAAAWLLIR